MMDPELRCFAVAVPNMDKHKAHNLSLKRLLLPTVLVLLVACLALAVVFFQAVRQLDSTSRQASANAIEAIVDHETARLSVLAYDYSWWDQAVISLVSNPDPEWAQDNIGSYLAETFDLTVSFVIGPEETTMFAFLDGQPSDLDAYSVIGPAVTLLATKARAAPTDEPAPVSAFVASGEELLLISASAITSEQVMEADDDTMPRGVLMLGMLFPNEHIEHFAEIAGAADISLQPVAPSSDRLAIPLIGLDGEALAYLTWTVEAPGAALLDNTIVPIVVALLAALVLILIAFRNAAAVLGHEGRMHKLLQAEQEFAELQSRFIAMSSHKLRTPLSVIQAAAELISGYRDRISSQDVTREADAIIRSVGELDAMIEATTKLERNHLDTDTVPSRNICIEELVADIWNQREDSPALEMTGSAWVHGDERHLRTVLTSILENASKFGVGERPVEVLIKSDGEVVMVRVKDHGIGIASLDLERLGIPFVRGSNAEAFPGNGIGLAVAKHILNWMGGSLHIESELHEGTTVTVRLPVGNEAPMTGGEEQQ